MTSSNYNRPIMTSQANGDATASKTEEVMIESVNVNPGLWTTMDLDNECSVTR